MEPFRLSASTFLDRIVNVNCIRRRLACDQPMLSNHSLVHIETNVQQLFRITEDWTVVIYLRYAASYLSLRFQSVSFLPYVHCIYQPKCWGEFHFGRLSTVVYSFCLHGSWSYIPRMRIHRSDAGPWKLDLTPFPPVRRLLLYHGIGNDIRL